MGLLLDKFYNSINACNKIIYKLQNLQFKYMLTTYHLFRKIFKMKILFRKYKKLLQRLNFTLKK